MAITNDINYSVRCDAKDREAVNDFVSSHGKRARAGFHELAELVKREQAREEIRKRFPGGEALFDLVDDCHEKMYSALGSAFEEAADSGAVSDETAERMRCEIDRLDGMVDGLCGV